MKTLFESWNRFLIKEDIQNSINFIEKYFNPNDKPINYEDSQVFKEYEIDEFIKGGGHGNIFGLKDTNRVIKIFNGAAGGLEKDIARIKKIIDQVFKGNASIEDMHYYEVGKFGTNGYYYLVMPRIIPVEETEFFQRDADFFEDFINIVSDASKYFDNNHEHPNYSRQDLENKVINDCNKLMNMRDKLKISKYNKITSKLLDAAYRATKLYGGTDLHAGNLGFIRQKPEIFFYFDMI